MLWLHIRARFAELAENDFSWENTKLEKKLTKLTKVADLNVFREYLKEKEPEEGNFLLYAYCFWNKCFNTVIVPALWTWTNNKVNDK